MFPTRLLLRWELGVRVLVALAVPLLVSSLFGGILSGLLTAVVAAAVSTSYAGPDAGSLKWSTFSAFGSVVAAIGGIYFGSSASPVQLVLVFALYTVFGAMLLAGLTTQLAFTPVATLGLVTIVLSSGVLTWQTVLQIVLGAAWGLLLIVVLPRWSGWPRLPLPPGALDPDTRLLRRMVRRPRLTDWGFPLLLGALAAAVLLVAALLDDNSRPYWAVLGLVAVLGPARRQTVDAGGQVVAATVVGVLIGILLLQAPLPGEALAAVCMFCGAGGVLVLLTNPVVSRVLLTVLIVGMVALLTGADPGDVGGQRLIETVVGAAAGLLAAGAAEYLAIRLEEEHEEPELQEDLEPDA